MVSFSPSEVAEYYRVRLPQLNQRGPEWRGPCPIHRGTRDSFAVHPKTGLWNCHSACGRGGDIIELEMALTSADFKTARVEAYRIVGQPEASNGNRRIVATYDYRNEGGDLLYQAVRTDPKGFRQRQPDGKGGWLWNVKGVRLVLYRLPELLQRTAETVFVCEGEKDVHALESLGLLATCNPMGAGKWRSEYSEMLQGRKVVILPDNDEPGRRHAAAVADGLLRVGCQVSIIELPRGKDASDWIDVGGTRDELRSLFREHSAAPLTVGSLAEWRTRWGLDISKTESADETNLKSGEHNPGSLVTKCLADIEAKPVSWLWSGRIARGKVTILAGNPGLGRAKSQPASQRL